MKQHPIETLDPVFRWLDWAVAEYGLYIYMAMVWLSPLLIAWILSGGFWRRQHRRRRVVKAPPVIPQTKATPPQLPVIIVEEHPLARQSPDDIQAFAASRPN